MATSGRIEATSNISSVYTLRADWNRISIDIPNNKERIGVNCYLFRNDGYATSAWSSNANERRTTLTVNGITQQAKTMGSKNVRRKQTNTECLFPNTNNR